MVNIQKNKGLLVAVFIACGLALVLVVVGFVSGKFLSLRPDPAKSALNAEKIVNKTANILSVTIDKQLTFEDTKEKLEQEAQDATEEALEEYKRGEDKRLRKKLKNYGKSSRVKVDYVKARVKRGPVSVKEVAVRYDVKASDVAQVNNVDEDYTFKKGDSIIVPKVVNEGMDGNG